MNWLYSLPGGGTFFSLKLPPKPTKRSFGTPVIPQHVWTVGDTSSKVSSQKNTIFWKKKIIRKQKSFFVLKKGASLWQKQVHTGNFHNKVVTLHFCSSKPFQLLHRTDSVFNALSTCCFFLLKFGLLIVVDVSFLEKLTVWNQNHDDLLPNLVP